MQQSTPSLANTIGRYLLPLQRYARRLIKNEALAALLVKTVFEQLYQLDGLSKTGKQLRQQLIIHTHLACCGHLQAGQNTHTSHVRSTTPSPQGEGAGGEVKQCNYGASIAAPQGEGAGGEVHMAGGEVHNQPQPHQPMLSHGNNKQIHLLKTAFSKKPKNPT